MRQVTLEVPDDALRFIGKEPVEFARAVYEAAVVQWFDEGRISQGKASELLGISRGEFFDLLSEHKVSPIQMTPQELREECGRG